MTPEETRQRLLDAAARVFELKGYEGATVSLIASEAGVTTGAIYTHYGSKAELLAAALKAHRDRAIASLRPKGQPDAATVLAALGQRLRARDRDTIALLVEAIVGARRDPELKDVLTRALSDHEHNVAFMLAAAQEAGQLDDSLSPDVAARFMLMLGLGSALVQSLDLPPAGRAEWNTFIQRLIGAVTPEESA